MLRTDHGWLLFRFDALRYQKMADGDSSWRGDGWNRGDRWLTLSSPGGVFRPMQAVRAGMGQFYLVDAGQQRLCLYDTGAQLLSTFPLPAALPPAQPGRVEVFRGANGSFTFLDYFDGEAWQYVDRYGGEGAPDWVLRNHTRLPLGLDACWQDPGGLGLACQAQRSPMRLDDALNRVGAGTTARGPVRMVWDPQASEWVLEAKDARSAALLLQFRPAQRRLTTAPL